MENLAGNPVKRIIDYNPTLEHDHDNHNLMEPGNHCLVLLLDDTRAWLPLRDSLTTWRKPIDRLDLLTIPRRGSDKIKEGTHNPREFKIKEGSHKPRNRTEIIKDRITRVKVTSPESQSQFKEKYGTLMKTIITAIVSKTPLDNISSEHLVYTHTDICKYIYII
jgi:hypothetical protein